MRMGLKIKSYLCIARPTVIVLMCRNIATKYEATKNITSSYPELTVGILTTLLNRRETNVGK